MATPIMMPKQGQSVESCILSEWHKKQGDTIQNGDILFTYETDKATFEYESNTEGVLLKIFYEEGDEVSVLTNVAVIGEQGEAVEEYSPRSRSGAEERSSGKKQEKEEKNETAKKSDHADFSDRGESRDRDSGKAVTISPRAKRLAEQHRIFYDRIAGTGPYGRIIERDIQHALQEKPKGTALAYKMGQEKDLSAEEAGTGVGGRITDKDLVAPDKIYQKDHDIKKLSNVRKLIASAMHASLQNTAQLTHHMSADARNVLQLRKEVKAQKAEGQSPDITLHDMICYALIKALKNHPSANAHFAEDHIKIFHKVHLGFAVDTDRGLMVPVVRNADDLTLEGLSNQMKALAGRCKQGDIDPELIASEAASFTVSNLGAYGVEMFTPILNLPQVGILGVNTIVNRPADLGNGTFGFVPFIGLSLTYDHRAIDGAPASLFLKTIKEEIEQFSI
jgi:pyruvate dehydrogenase E2 component (dihydrolipoamide acetyltransferase)